MDVSIAVGAFVPDLAYFKFGRLTGVQTSEDTTSIRKKSIGKPSIHQPSVGQVYGKSIDWSSHTLIRQLDKLLIKTSFGQVWPKD